MTRSKLKTLFGAFVLSGVVAGCNVGDTAPPEDATCGDGVTESPEVCDDGNTDDGDYCAGDCSAATGFCGDGDTQLGAEACDDGNTDDGDYCSADCLTETSVCGDGVEEGDEACDDGNTDGDDYCAADCSASTGSCGDGTTQAGVEVCDDGNDDDDDYCAEDCQTITGACGDGLRQDNEGCDDGNTDGDDYCAGDCSDFTGRCGDLMTQGNEACDDGNNDDGDYCAGDCQTSFGACGDDEVQDFEACDDGNAEDGDYCSADCQALTGSCGDTIVQGNEACDDGDNDDGDYCSADCTMITGECGDGVLQEGEECDDANDIDDDLCTSACARNPLRYDADVTIDTPTVWPAGVDITFDPGTTLTVTSELTLSEGILLKMGAGSTIEVAAGSLTIEGNEDYPVTLDDEDDSSRCGSWSGLVVEDGTLLARHFTYQRAAQGIRAVDSTVVIEDARVLDVCAPDASGSGIGGVAIGLNLLRDTATVRRLIVDGVYAGSPSGVNGTFGNNGSYARGVSFDKSEILAIEDVSIANVEASDATPGIVFPVPGLDGGAGGIGGDAAGLRIRNRTGADTTPLTIERLVIDQISAGAGGDGGGGAPGSTGRNGSSASQSSRGGDGGDGGDGGGGGDALALDIEDVGALTIANLLITRVQGAAAGSGGRAGDGGRGGNGFIGGGFPNITIRNPSPGGDGGRGGDSASPGTSAGVRAIAAQLVIEHVTTRELSAGALGGFGGAGSRGSGGTLSGNTASNGMAGSPGRQALLDVVPAGVRVSLSLVPGATDPIVRFCVFVASPAAYGIAALAGVTIMSDFNLFEDLREDYDGVAAGANDVAAAPLFVNATSRDFTPSTASPLFDAATGSTATLDVYGNPRDATPDIGAIENVPVTP